MANSLNIKPEEVMLDDLNSENDPEMRKCVYTSTSDGNSHIQLEASTTKKGISHNSSSQSNESTQNGISRSWSKENLFIKIEKMILEDLDWENEPACVEKSLYLNDDNPKNVEVNTTNQGISHNSNFEIQRESICKFSTGNESTQNNMISNESFVIKSEEVMLDDIDWENEPQCVGTSTSPNENSTNTLKLSITKQGISHNSNPEILEKDVCALPESNESTQNNMISNASFVIKPEEVMLDDIDWAKEPQCVGTSTSPDENSTNKLKLSATKQGISHNSNSMMQKENVYVLSASNESTPSNEISKIENHVIKPNAVNLEKPAGIEKSLCTYENNPKNSEVISTNQIVSHVFNQEEDEDSDFFHELSNSDEFSEYSDSAEPTHIKENLPIRGKLGLVPANRVLDKITMPNESVQNNIKNSFSTEVEKDGTSEIAIPNELVQNNIKENSNTELQRVNTSQIAMLNESTQNNIEESSSTRVERANTTEIAMLNESVQNNIKNSSSTEVKRDDTSEIAILYPIAMLNESVQNNIKESSITDIERADTSEIAILKELGQINIEESSSTEIERADTSEIEMLNELGQNNIEESSSTEIERADTSEIAMPNELVQNNIEENSNTELQRVNTSQIAMLNELVQNNIEESSSTEIERADTSEIAMPNELVQNNIEENSNTELQRVNTSQIAMLNELLQNNIEESSSTEIERADTSEIAMPNELVQNNIEENSNTELQRVNTSQIAMLNELVQNNIEESSSTEIERADTSEFAMLNELVQNNIEESSSTEIERADTSEIAMPNELVQNNIEENSNTELQRVNTSQIAMLHESTQNNIEESSSTQVERANTSEIAMLNESVQNNIKNSFAILYPISMLNYSVQNSFAILYPIGMLNESVQNNIEENSNTELQRVNTRQIAMLNESTQNNIEKSSSTEIERADTSEIVMLNESVQNNIKNSSSTELERDGSNETAILYQIAMPNESVQNNIEENSNTELQRVNTSQIAMLNESTQNNIEKSSSTEIERADTSEIVMLNESVQNNIKNSSSTELERDGSNETAILYQIAMPNESVQNNIEENSNTELQRVNTSQIAMLNEWTQNNMEESCSTEIERADTSEIAMLNESVQNNIGESSSTETRNNIRNSSQTRGLGVEAKTLECQRGSRRRGRRRWGEAPRVRETSGGAGSFPTHHFEREMEVFQTLPLCSGKPKLNARNYIMLLDKKTGDRHYWYCNQKRNHYCPGRVITQLVEGNHVVQKFKDHNHPASPHSIETIKFVNAVKTTAKHTNDLPCRVIETAMASTSEIDCPYLPSVNALRSMIHNIRRENRPAEPRTVSDINVLPAYRVTLKGDEFLIIDVTSADNTRILVFSTSTNIRHLSEGEFWIMDGTFKTVPTLFYQLYTIHTKVGFTNSRILPMVYILMTAKSQVAYSRLFEEIKQYAATHGVTLAPQILISDLEIAAINASQSVFPGVENKVCFFHFGQCVWRNIQKSGLADNYQNDRVFALKLRQLTALAFVPAVGIPAALEVLRPTMPVEANVVVKWLDEHYVNGKDNIQPDGTVTRIPPRYPPEMWSIYSSTIDCLPRTQNVVEAWHRRWETLVGRAHVGFHKIMVEFQKEQNTVESVVEQILEGAPRPKLRREAISRESRIQFIVQEYWQRTTLEYLQGLAQNFQFR
ncbi:uncharacterized protein LOC143916644 [Arctopsyche grandis]|uniref:uncharacterized protein LOC143916644 n=1 Tax=Arctopsyche grandis TaxID=121162 RepID=UPI00406D8AE2